MPRYRQSILLFILFLQFCSVGSYAQKSTEKIEADIRGMFEIGRQALTKGDYPKALQYFTKADIVAEGTDFTGYKLSIKFGIGRVYREIHSLGDALKYYNDALIIVTNNPKYEETGITIMVDIGILYLQKGDIPAALEYYKKSYDKAKEINSDSNIVISAINLSDAYNRLGRFGLSRKHLDEVKDLKMDHASAQTLKINYAESYFKEGRFKEAEAIMRKVWGKIDTTNENDCLLCAVKLLSQINGAKGNISEAISYAKLGLKNSRSVKDRAEMYTLLSDTYYNDQQYQNAAIYKDSLLIANNSMSESVQSSLYAINKVRLEIQDYQSEARYNEEKRATERNLFILVIGLVIVLFYFIFRNLRNRITKQNQEKIIVENKQKIYELELDKLTGDIAEKNRKLSAKALYLSGRNALIEEVINSLDHIPEIQQANVHNHIKTLRGHLRADEEWDDFISYFEQINPNFLKLLHIRHPQLNAADIRFICYLYMNLDLKEISSILNITIEASRKRKQRIAKKMDLDIDSLNHYIMKLG